MIITEEELQKILQNYKNKYPNKISQWIGFIDGINAMWKLVIKTNKADKIRNEHIKELTKLYDEEYNRRKIKK